MQKQLHRNDLITHINSIKRADQPHRPLFFA